MHGRIRPLLLVALPILTACVERRSTGVPLRPPEGTGQQAIQMQGEWRISQVETLVTFGGNAAELSNDAGVTPPRAGTTIEIDDVGFADGNGLDLRADTLRSQGTLARYSNHVDGRYAIFDVLRLDPADGGRFELTIALGSLPQDAMVGVLAFNRDGANLDPDLVRSGLFRFRLDRVR